MKTKDKVKNNVIYFDTDEEFTDFCLAPYAIIEQTDNGILYYTGEYSDEYLRCIDEDKSFIIRDEDSEVYKHQCVSKRLPVIYNGTSIGHNALIQLKVENLEPYFGY